MGFYKLDCDVPAQAAMTLVSKLYLQCQNTKILQPSRHLTCDSLQSAQVYIDFCLFFLAFLDWSSQTMYGRAAIHTDTAGNHDPLFMRDPRNIGDSILKVMQEHTGV